MRRRSGPPKVTDDAAVTGLEKDNSELRLQLAEALQAAGATAHLAKAEGRRRTEEVQLLRRELAKEREKNAALEQDTDRLGRQVLDLQARLRSAKPTRSQEGIAFVSPDADAMGTRVEELERALATSAAREAAIKMAFKRKQAEWQEMYQEWMTKAEGKIQELNEANRLIQTSLRKAT